MMAVYFATFVTFVAVITLLAAMARLSGRSATPRCVPDGDCACRKDSGRGADEPANSNAAEN